MKREILYGQWGPENDRPPFARAFHADPESDACDVGGADGSHLDSGRVARLGAPHAKVESFCPSCSCGVVLSVRFLVSLAIGAVQLNCTRSVLFDRLVYGGSETSLDRGIN
jgi:hypothetical protein